LFINLPGQVRSINVPNIEIKSKYPNAEKAKSIARELGAQYAGVDRQVDTYFKTKSGRLKLRESSLSGAQLVPYIRPDELGPKKSEYLVIPVENAELCKNLFSQILGTEVVVEKSREIFLVGNVRVHIDEVQGLGSFFEFEAVYSDSKDEAQERNKVEKLIKHFEIAEDDLLTLSYRELKLNSVK
jgi:adenylate cyclase class 2